MIPGGHRPTARVLLHYRREIFLLLRTHFDPEVQLPPRWLIPGGGIDQGETPRATAVRELLEETGLVLSEDQLGEIVYQERGEWLWGDGVNSHTYEDHVFEFDISRLDLSPESLVLDKSSWTQDEHRDVLEIRWWSAPELIATSEPVSPKGLASWLRSWL